MPSFTAALVPPVALQAVTKYSLEAAGNEGLINIRDAFVAPPGSVLIAADYSQASGGASRAGTQQECCRCKLEDLLECLLY